MSHFNFYNYPIDFVFRIGTLHNDFTAKDAIGNTVAYVKQKLFKFKEHVQIYSNTNQTELLYEIRADRWLDFNACYTFYNNQGIAFGKLTRKGWKSLWSAKYEILDESNNLDLIITEANPLVKFFDAFIGEIPILNFFTGYLFNPKYHIKRPNNDLVFECKKKGSFFGRKFKLTNHSLIEKGEEQRVLLGLMMMLLLERRRG